MNVHSTKFKSHTLIFFGAIARILSYKKRCGLRMSTKCKKCGKLIEPQFEMDADLDIHICPECGCSIDANTSGIHVLGRDM